MLLSVSSAVARREPSSLNVRAITLCAGDKVNSNSPDLMFHTFTSKCVFALARWGLFGLNASALTKFGTSSVNISSPVSTSHTLRPVSWPSTARSVPSRFKARLSIWSACSAVCCSVVSSTEGSAVITRGGNVCGFSAFPEEISHTWGTPASSMVAKWLPSVLRVNWVTVIPGLIWMGSISVSAVKPSSWIGPSSSRTDAR